MNWSRAKNASKLGQSDFLNLKTRKEARPSLVAWLLNMSLRTASSHVPTALEDVSWREQSKFQIQKMERRREHAGGVCVPGSRCP